MFYFTYCKYFTLHIVSFLCVLFPTPLCFSALFLALSAAADSALRSLSRSLSRSPLSALALFLRSRSVPRSRSVYLTSKIILHTHNVVFIGRMTCIRVLPDFGNNRIGVETYQAVALTLCEFNRLTFGVVHEFAFLVVV